MGAPPGRAGVQGVYSGLQLLTSASLQGSHVATSGKPLREGRIHDRLGVSPRVLNGLGQAGVDLGQEADGDRHSRRSGRTSDAAWTPLLRAGFRAGGNAVVPASCLAGGPAVRTAVRTAVGIAVRNSSRADCRNAGVTAFWTACCMDVGAASLNTDGFAIV